METPKQCNQLKVYHKDTKKNNVFVRFYVGNFEQFWAHGIFCAIAEKLHMCVSGGIKC